MTAPLLLAQWRRLTAPALSETAFDSLLKLLNKIVHSPNFKPDDFPTSFYELDTCEEKFDMIVNTLL
jgi:hypothetical protein